MIHEQLRDDTRDYWVGYTVPYLDNPSPIQFLKATNGYHPFIIRGLANTWDAFKTWNMEYLKEKIGDTSEIIINITPDGLADSAKTVSKDEELSDMSIQEIFTYPCELSMKFGDFVEMMTNPREDDAIPYLSQQNDNFRSTSCLDAIRNDVPSSISLMDEVFEENTLEAVNIWIGDERSISSVHKDHYENLYAVISGEKLFTLMPPTDVAFLPEKTFRTIKYKINENSNTNRPKSEDITFDIDSLSPDSKEGDFKWIDIDPEDPLAEFKYPYFKYASPIKCSVQAGEILFLPSLWYHRVSQSKLTIAVNYWYEQIFNFRYVFYNVAKNLAVLRSMEETAEDQEYV